MAEKFTGAHTLGAESFSVQMAGQPSRTVSIAADDWYVDDLLDEIESDLQAHAEFTSMTWTLDSSGVVQIAGGSGSFATTVTWGTATEVRDILRFSGTTEVFFETASAERTHLGGFYPSRSVIQDLEGDDHIAVQTRTDTAAYGLYYAAFAGENLLVPAVGYPRSGSYTEYHALQSFITDWCAQSRRFRYYRDASETSAFDVTSAPNGYIVRKADLDSVRRWAPIPMVPDWYKYWVHPLRLIQASDS